VEPIEYIVDTSVVVEWFVSEDESDLGAARGLRDAYLRGRCSLRSPDFMLLELANALKAGRRFSASEVGLILRSLRKFHLRIEAVRWDTLTHAVAIASRNRTSVYDSYFLALAIESEAMLVTADEIFLRLVAPQPNAVSVRDLPLADRISDP
jgi:predicted nucleic acid-binding protein